jgi:hypothetical protein
MQLSPEAGIITTHQCLSRQGLHCMATRIAISQTQPGSNHQAQGLKGFIRVICCCVVVCSGSKTGAAELRSSPVRRCVGVVTSINTLPRTGCSYIGATLLMQSIFWSPDAANQSACCAVVVARPASEHAIPLEPVRTCLPFSQLHPAIGSPGCMCCTAGRQVLAAVMDRLLRYKLITPDNLPAPSQ